MCLLEKRLCWTFLIIKTKNSTIAFYEVLLKSYQKICIKIVYNFVLEGKECTAHYLCSRLLVVKCILSFHKNAVFCSMFPWYRQPPKAIFQLTTRKKRNGLKKMQRLQRPNLQEAHKVSSVFCVTCFPECCYIRTRKKGGKSLAAHRIVLY